MSLNWPDERYVRAYIRDTPSWLVAPWEARAFLLFLLRKLDRNGELDLGDDGIDALAATVQMPLEMVKESFAHWLKRGTIVMVGCVLTMPNFIAAQECSKSDSLRAQEYRDRKRGTGCDATVTKRDDASRIVMDPSQVERPRHASSRGVTPSVPNLTVPNQPRERSPLPTSTPVLDEQLALVSEEPKKRGKADREKRGTRCPSSDSPDAAEFCRVNGLAPPTDPETADFLDYWSAVPGHKGLSLNWTATWRRRPQWLAERAKERQQTATQKVHRWNGGPRMVQPGVPDAPWMQPNVADPNADDSHVPENF